MHPRFQPVSPGVGEGSADIRAISGRYVLSSRYDGLTVLDDQTGRRTGVVNSCSYQAFGPPWILFACSSDNPGDSGLRLYNIITHKQSRLPCTGTTCSEVALLLGRASGAQIGARWIFFTSSTIGDCGDNFHYSCGPLAHTFINIRTGRLRYFYDQLSSTRIMDLNAPYATRLLCQPVMAGAVAGPYVPYADPVTFYGDFAATYTLSGQGKRTITTYLERCGSSLHMPIDPPTQNGFRGPIGGNAHAVVWMVLDASGMYHHQLHGLLLPSLRRFTVALPPKIFACNTYGCLGGEIVGVSSRRLYLTDANRQLWAAPFPPVAPSKKKPRAILDPFAHEGRDRGLGRAGQCGDPGLVIASRSLGLPFEPMRLAPLTPR